MTTGGRGREARSAGALAPWGAPGRRRSGWGARGTAGTLPLSYRPRPRGSILLSIAHAFHPFSQHTNPAEAVQIAQDVRSMRSVACHHATFW